MPHIIDTHSHIHFEDYDADRGEVIARAREAGIAMVAIGTDLEESKRAIETAEKHPDDVLGATVGLHPTYDEAFDEAAFRKLAAHPKVVAIGECGLDYYRVTDPALLAKQKETFLRQINLAHALEKPLVIHCRNAFSDLISILEASKDQLLPERAGVIHFFSGTAEDARRLVDLGFYLGFGGVVTFTRDYDEAIKKVPAGRLVVETDAPYVAPVPHRGKRNESAFIAETVAKLAEIRGEDAEEFRNILLENTRALFGI